MSRRCWWMAGPVYLRVISVQTWSELVFVDQPQQFRHIQHEQDGSKNWPLWNSTQRKATVEEAVLQRRYCVRPSRYDWNQPSTWPHKPYDTFSRCSNVAWSTVSNATDKSSSVSTARSSGHSKRSEYVDEHLEHRCLCRMIGPACQL